MSIFNFWIKSSVFFFFFFFFFFANFKMKILISKKFVGNTPLGLHFKETFNDILIFSVVLSEHPAKVGIYGNLHYLAFKLFC